MSWRKQKEQLASPRAGSVRAQGRKQQLEENQTYWAWGRRTGHLGLARWVLLSLLLACFGVGFGQTKWASGLSLGPIKIIR